MARKPTRATSAATDQADDTLLSAVLDRAEAVGWDDLRLTEVARGLGLPPERLPAIFRDKDALANAWFGAALRAMLGQATDDLLKQPPPERLNRLLTAWLDSLATRRTLTRAMLRGKLYPGHPHHWLPMVFDLSRLVQWLRDAAGLTATGRQRQVEEIALTLLVLRLLARWCRDESRGQEASKILLRRLLDRGDRWMARRFA